MKTRHCWQHHEAHSEPSQAHSWAPHGYLRFSLALPMSSSLPFSFLTTFLLNYPFFKCIFKFESNLWNLCNAFHVMQVWLFATKRSQLPQQKYSLWQPQGQVATKRTFPFPQKRNRKDGNTNQMALIQWTLQLQNRQWLLRWRVVSPQKRKWIRVWDELNWMASGGTAAAIVFLPVCKHAVSKSRPSSGIITAQHHMTATRPAPNISTQEWHDLIFHFVFWNVLTSTFFPLPVDEGDSGGFLGSWKYKLFFLFFFCCRAAI